MLEPKVVKSAVATVGLLVSAAFYLKSRRDSKKQHAELMSVEATVSSFEAQLGDLGAQDGLIERIDVDRPDPDNYAAVLLRILFRRRRRKFWRKFWMTLRGRMLGSWAVGAGEKVHVVLVGRRVSSSLSHMVPKPKEGGGAPDFELEIWDQGTGPGGADPDEQPRIVVVSGKELGKHYIKEQPWEDRFFNEEEERLLVGLSAAHLRCYLRHCGVGAWEYEVYDGGIAEKAGLSCHIHSYDFQFLSDDTCETFSLTSKKDYDKFLEEYRGKTVAERRDYFRARTTRPSEARRRVDPLSKFTDRCRANPSLPLVLYAASPLVALKETFVNDKDLSSRVVLCTAMLGAWHGEKNLLGTNFNVGVSYDATCSLLTASSPKEAAAGGPGAPWCKGALNLFPNCRFVLFPTETCKNEAFILKAEDISSIKTAKENLGFREVIVKIVDQWTEMKRGAQPLFDVVIQIPICDMLPYGICKAGLTFGKTDKTEFGLSMVPMKGEETFAFADLKGSAANDVCLGPDSPFVGGTIYATLEDPKEDMKGFFTNLLGTLLEPFPEAERA